jgi:hypothetical protein
MNPGDFFLRLRLETVWSAEQVTDLANVWLVQQQHDHAKQTHAEASVRRSAVLEEVEVGL